MNQSINMVEIDAVVPEKPKGEFSYRDGVRMTHAEARRWDQLQRIAAKQKKFTDAEFERHLKNLRDFGQTSKE